MTNKPFQQTLIDKAFNYGVPSVLVILIFLGIAVWVPKIFDRWDLQIKQNAEQNGLIRELISIENRRDARQELILENTFDIKMQLSMPTQRYQKTETLEGP